MTDRATPDRSVGLRRRLFVALLVLGAAVAGWFLRAALAPAVSTPATAAGTNEESEPRERRVWTCSMHPQIQTSEPGDCPICGMDLIPLESGGGSGRPGTLALSEAARELIRVRTHPVERRIVEHEIRLVGKIRYDETRLAHLTAWAPGRLVRMFVDYTGVEVAAGDHMVDLYSPKIYTDQTVLIEALDALRNLDARSSQLERRALEATLDAARERLRQLGLGADQIAEIEERGTASEQITIYSPIGGVVVDKQGQPGMYVEVGSRIYTVADLTHLWVQLDAYESDLQWLHYGQPVEFTTEAFPGEVFHGTISFLSRELDPKTLTVKVRVNLDNLDGLLRPGMFVRATVRTKVAGGGRTVDPGLAGKWICPMHPEIVREEPTTCDLCGMDLVTTESLGYVPAAAAEPSLVIPATAPLRTGRRAIVYVEHIVEGEAEYEAREVVLGPRAGDWYLVETGLEAGERVVVNGNFKIDSALQILAGPSMMAPREDAPVEEARSHRRATRSTRVPRTSTVTPPPHEGNSEPALEVDAEAPEPELDARPERLWSSYLELGRALAADDFAAATATASAAAELAREFSLDVEEPDRVAVATALAEHLAALTRARDLESARASFERMTEPVLALVTLWPVPGDAFLLECPMAFGEGAGWLQDAEKVANPYYGSQMLRCGSVERRVSGGGGTDD